MVLNVLTWLLEQLGDASGNLNVFIGSYGYLAVFILMTLEAAAVPIPSEVVLPLIGLLAAQGIFSLPIALAIVLIAGIIGMFVDYYIAYFFGKDVVYKHMGIFHIKKKNLDDFDDAFRRNGKFTVFITRMMPLVKALINFPAGFAMMNKKEFIVYSVAGSLVWDLVLIMVGYYGLASSNVYVVMSVIAVFAVVIYAIYKLGVSKMRKA